MARRCPLTHSCAAGDAFYIVESGTVDVYVSDQGVEPVARIEKGGWFGEKALMTEDVRQATCIASTDAKCLSLVREDFVRMLGSLQDLLSGTAVRPSTAKQQVAEPAGGLPLDGAQQQHSFELADLDIKRTLGIGAFGRVKLVKVKPDRIPPNGDPNQTYALKCLSKAGVVDNGLQEHVVNEKMIMAELNHPFILTFHGAMQDEHNVYFLLEVLLGGELFRTLRCEGQFSESTSRFYAASVMLAFCQIHSKKVRCVGSSPSLSARLHSSSDDSRFRGTRSRTGTSSRRTSSWTRTDTSRSSTSASRRSSTEASHGRSAARPTTLRRRSY